jgi:hypothetical protein
MGENTVKQGVLGVRLGLRAAGSFYDHFHFLSSGNFNPADLKPG